MDILQEVTHSLQLIDELLFSIYKKNKEDLVKLQNKLPDIEHKHLKYLTAVYKKLNSDDEYSLSEKGLSSFRNSTQHLLHHLRVKEKEAQHSELKNSTKDSRLLSYKSFLLNHKLQLTFFETATLIAILIGGLFISLIATLAVFTKTDQNYLVIFSEIIFLLLLYAFVFHSENDLNNELRFRLGHTALLLWRVLCTFFAIALIPMIIVKYKPFWLDDILIVLYLSLPVLVIYYFSKGEDWLAEALELTQEKSNNVEAVHDVKVEK